MPFGQAPEGFFIFSFLLDAEQSWKVSFRISKDDHLLPVRVIEYAAVCGKWRKYEHTKAENRYCWSWESG